MKKKVLLLLLRVVISFGLIAYFLWSLAEKQGGLGAAFNQFTNAFSGASMTWLILAASLHLVGFMLVSLRWRILLTPQGVEASYKQLFAYYFMAAFFNSFLPSTIGGDTIRAIESKKLTGSASTSVMVVIIERLTGLMALVLIAACALLIKISQSASSQATVLLFLVSVIAAFTVLIFCAHPKIAPKILGLLKKILPAKIHQFLVQAYEAVTTYYKKPKALLSALGISIIFQLNMVLYYFLIAVALNRSPNIIDFMMLVPIMVFLLMTVPAINGLGVRTAGFTGLMKFPAAYAFAVECIDIVFRIGYGLLGGLFFLFYRKNKVYK
jgi:glycosyltransferase 2 family protein